jgi:FlaA1/EpsC-like NDP-sugar epimerase
MINSTKPFARGEWLFFKQQNNNKTMQKIDEKQIQEWKEKYGSVYELPVEDKTAYLREPDMKDFKRAFTAMQTNGDLAFGEEMINILFIGGATSVDRKPNKNITDITNKEELQAVFDKHQPEVVFHAAAYKHVPVLETNFMQAIKVNVFGTKNVLDLAIQYGVQRFVYVSTDKAVNPTNIMGASKRIAEIMVQSRFSAQDSHNRTQIITTRFGNVLGSNGSVVNLFENQIREGGPVTVTHPEINRFFMTIPEACKLVLEAGTMGMGGEIYIFDMGKPIKIRELAEKMIRLSGKEPYTDIDIIYTGLRPGEKLYEEVLSEASRTLPTYNPKILIAQDPVYCYEKVERFLNNLNTTSFNTKQELIHTILELVPEFIQTPQD